MRVLSTLMDACSSNDVPEEGSMPAIGEVLMRCFCSMLELASWRCLFGGQGIRSHCFPNHRRRKRIALQRTTVLCSLPNTLIEKEGKKEKGEGRHVSGSFFFFLIGLAAQLPLAMPRHHLCVLRCDMFLTVLALHLHCKRIQKKKIAVTERASLSTEGGKKAVPHRSLVIWASTTNIYFCCLSTMGPAGRKTCNCGASSREANIERGENSRRGLIQLVLNWILSGGTLIRPFGRIVFNGHASSESTKNKSNLDR